MAKLAKVGYGQLELNNAAFRRDGRIEAQCALDATDFASIPAENGMILAVDRAAKKVYLPDGTNAEPEKIYMINYSAEHLYDERAMGLKNFALAADDFYPRLGVLSVQDKFTTNTVEMGAVTLTALKTALAAGTVYYGGIDASGYIAIGTTKPTIGPVLRVVEVTTMPDGQDALRFVCVAE